MQVCINGHQITTMLKSCPHFSQQYCKQCGSKTIFKCKHCEVDIRGYYHTPRVTSLHNIPVPDCCHGCGKPYPWQGRVKTSEKSNKIAPSEIIECLFSRLPQVIKQLRKRHGDRDTLNVQDEYDLQDLLHSLLKINFDDIRPEEYTSSYAGSTSRMDFLLPDEEIVVETKMTRQSLNNKKLSRELLEDRERYQKHANCRILYCLVYDPDERINNPRGFEEDMSKKNEKFVCKVRIVH